MSIAPAPIGSKGSDEGKFKDPVDVKVDSNGNLVVCEFWNHRCQVVRPDGSFVSFVGSKGSTNGCLERPNAVALDQDGRMFISNSFHNRIEVFAKDGTFTHNFGTEGSEPGQLDEPNGITIDKNNQVIVSDSANHRLSVFNEQGQFVKTIGSHGNEGNQFNTPSSLAVNSMGQLIICDSGNERISVYDSNLNVQFHFTRSDFWNMMSLACDSNDNIIVSNYYKNNLSFFGKDGTFVSSTNSDTPRGLTCMPNGLIAVTDQKGHCVRFVTSQ